MLLLSALSAALAAPGHLLPDAAPAEDLTVRVGAVGLLAPEDPWGAFGVQGVVNAAPTASIGLEAQVPLLGLAGGGFAFGTAANAGARVIVLDRPAIRLAPTVTLGALGTSTLGRLPVAGRTVAGAVGLAVDTGGERVRVDANLTGFAALWEPGGPALLLPPQEGSLLLSELGVTAALGTAHHLRLGLNLLVPTLTWSYDADPLVIDATVGVAGVVNLAAVHVGRRF